MKKRENDAADFRLFCLPELRRVKLTFLFILLAFMQVSARSQEKITVNFQSADLKKALAVIERKSDYHFLYNESVIANKPKVDLNVKDAEITAVLDKILVANGISYRILNSNLIVLKAIGDDSKTVIPDIRVSGKVTGTNGVALAGVSVTIKGSATGTVTDDAGNYAISVPEENSVLVFSYVGYTTQEVNVGGRTTINVSLVASANQLDQVVVVGYGTQRKVDVTGTVTQIRGEEVSRQPVMNPISGLQGRVAGVQITNSGAPGASPQIRIRGVGTVYGNANPLYVVDGVWYDDISFLNPADIETMSILKDASSEAIYGIRAANGVVLVTTRKGRNAKPVVNYNGYVGNQVVTNEVKMANGPQYAQMVNELDAIGGIAGRYKDPNSYGTTDWYHRILRDALTTNHQVSVSGGSERSTYNFSLGYLMQDGIVEKNRFDRYTAKLQNDFQVFTPLKLGYVITGSMNKSTDIPGSIFHQLYASVPIVPVYYADGTYGDPNDFNVTSSANFNPQVTLDFFNQKSKNYRLTGTMYADLKFAKYFTFHTSIGGDFGQNEARNYNPVYAATLAQRNSISKLTLTDAKTRNWILENTLTYDNRFGDHNVRVLVGQGAQSYKFDQTISSADNVPNNSDAHYLSLGTNWNVIDSRVNEFPLYDNVASYFGRVNYSFQNKYLLTATLRADGSSKFAKENRWGYFPSVGVGWVITEEKFMNGQSIFNNLKLRGSWGQVGNRSVPANLSVRTVTQIPQFIYVGGNGTTAPGANINTIVPPTTYWEKGVGTDIGLEASLLKNKLYTEIVFYNKKTVKGIFAIPILGSLGTSGGTIIGNQATYQNRGFEIALNWKDNALNKKLSYSLSGNLGINNNKVLNVSTGTNPIYQAVGTTGSNNFNTRTIQGQPIGQFVGLKVIGVFQSAAEVQNYVSKNGTVLMPNARAGDLKMADINEDGVIDDKDRVVLGNPNPKYTYGFNTSFTYGQFDLSLDFQGIAGVDIYNANLALRFGTENFTEDFYKNRWHGQGTSTLYPSVYLAGGQNPRANSFYVEDGSYFRVRNAQLGYTLSRSITERWRINKLRVFANAQNPLNFFKYRGFTPEVGSSPTRAGVDVDVYPLYATYNFGVNLTF
ncbi:MAG: TonB-dependent receptor [Flavisolibacter sp.]|nr:TonB-dependent receptor [Flavisolibacter sp.]